MKNSASQPASLILITVDSLRADHVGFLGYQRPTTPFLDAMAQESLVIPVAVVAGAPTYYSFPAIFASRYPLDLGRDVIGLAPGESTLTSVLQDAGYATAAFCAGNPYLTQRFGYHQGFDVFRDFLNHDSAPANPPVPEARLSFTTRLNRTFEKWSNSSRWTRQLYQDLYFQYCQRVATSPANSVDELRCYPSAEVLVNEAHTWLASLRGQPFFLWLHLMDTHAPYYPDPRALQAMGYTLTVARARYLNCYWNRSDLDGDGLRSHRESVMGLYDASIRWVDLQIARLIEILKQSHVWDHCALALTADHGEEFLEHGGRFHSPDKLAEEVIRVPLLLRVPGHGSSNTGMNSFSLIHLAPTLLDLLGVQIPSEFRGQSCWSQFQSRTLSDDCAIIECVAGATNPFHRRNRIGPRLLAVRDSRFKLVWDLASGKELLFDLERDAKELLPLKDGEATTARRTLMLRARQHLLRSEERLDERLRWNALLRELASEPASWSAFACPEK